MGFLEDLQQLIKKFFPRSPNFPFDPYSKKKGLKFWKY